MKFLTLIKEKYNKQFVLVTGIIITFLISYLDIITEPFTYFLVLVILPIIYVTWYAGKSYGVILTVLFNLYYVINSSSHMKGDSAGDGNVLNLFVILTATILVLILIANIRGYYLGMQHQYQLAKDETKVTQEKLQKTSKALEEFRHAIENISPENIFYTLNCSGKFIYINEHFERITGFSQSEIMEMNFFDLLHPDYSADSIDFTNRQICGSDLTGLSEIKIRNKRGNAVWLRQNVMMNLEGGEIIGLSILANDISEEIHLKEKIVENESKLSQIIDLVPHFIFAKDREGKFILANKRLADSYGTSKEDIIGKSDKDFNTSEEEIEWFRNDDLEVINTLRSKYIPIEKVTTINGVRFYETFKAPIFISKINEYAVLGVANDITERVMAERELKKLEMKFSNFAKNAPVALTRFNLTENKYDFVNDEFERQSGYTLEEYEKLSDQELINLIHPEDRDKKFMEFKNWMNDGMTGILRSLYRIVNKNGEIIWIDTYSYTDLDENGAVNYINQICVDVTDKMNTQKRIERSEERYKTFIENSTEGICRFEHSTPINLNQTHEKIVSDIYKYAYLAECNLEFAKMYGYRTVEEIVNTPLRVLQGGDDNPDNFNSKLAWIKSGFRVKNIETIEVNNRGERKYFLNSVIGIVEDGKLLRSWGTQIDITEHKQLQSLNKTLSEAIEQTHIAIRITDPAGVTSYVNSSFANVMGVPKSSLIGEKDSLIAELLSDSSPGGLSESGMWKSERIRVKENGEQFWEVVNISAIRDSSGKVLHYLIISEDVTEKRELEIKLTESDQRYKEFINQSIDAVYRMELRKPIDINEPLEKIVKHFFNYGYIAECNEAMAKIYAQRKASDLIGLSGKEISKSIDEYRKKYNFDNFIKNGFKLINDESKLVDPEGNERYILDNLFGIIEDGKLIRVWGIKRDITEIRMIEEEVRYLSNAVHQSPVAVAILNTGFKIMYVNKRFTEFTQYEEQEVIGKYPFILLDGQFSVAMQNEIKSSLKKGETWRGEILNKRKDGSEYWEISTLSSVKDKAGEITHYVYIKQDITQRKIVEAELLEAKKKAEELTKIKGEFLANMSHEIRTPLNGIIGMSQLLSTTDLNEEQNEYVDLVNISSHSLLNIINDILDFSKLESNKLKISEHPFNLRTLLTNIRSLNNKIATEKGIELRLNFGNLSDGNYIGDEQRINQVITNLVSNALKFTNEGYVEINCSARKGSQNNKDEITISVQDTGIGIPDDKIGYLFENFVQLENSYGKNYVGTGLGLSIVKKLVSLMDGEIEVKSKVGHGSEFIVKLNLSTTD